MEHKSVKQAQAFIHVHVCVHCGGAFRREQFEDRAQTTGIYLCPKCGVESALNLEIRANDTLDEDVAQANGSSGQS